MEAYWNDTLKCPTEEEYSKMVDQSKLVCLSMPSITTHGMTPTHDLFYDSNRWNTLPDCPDDAIYRLRRRKSVRGLAIH